MEMYIETYHCEICENWKQVMTIQCGNDDCRTEYHICQNCFNIKMNEAKTQTETK